MRQEGPHADHVEIQFAHQLEVAGQVVPRLAGDANHHTAADLVTQFSKDLQELDATGARAGKRRVNPAVKPRIGGFEPEQVSIGPGLSPEVKLFRQPLAQAQGHGQSQALLEKTNQIGDPLYRVLRIFAGLKNHRSITQVRLSSQQTRISSAVSRYRSSVALPARKPQYCALPTAVIRQLDEPAK